VKRSVFKLNKWGVKFHAKGKTRKERKMVMWNVIKAEKLWQRRTMVGSEISEGPEKKFKMYLKIILEEFYIGFGNQKPR